MVSAGRPEQADEADNAPPARDLVDAADRPGVRQMIGQRLAADQIVLPCKTLFIYADDAFPHVTDAQY